MKLTKQTFFFCFIMVAMLAVISCGSEEEQLSPIPSHTGGIRFVPTITTMSRATDTQFDAGDAISVFAVAAVDGGILESGNYADNVKYTYADGFFSAENGIHRPVDNGRLSFYAVYPYSIEVKNQFLFHVQSNQQRGNYTLSDLMTASTDATDAIEVDLIFRHRLSKLVVNLQGDNWPSGDMSLKLGGVYLSADVDFVQQIFNAVGEREEVVFADNGTKSFKVILPPQELDKENHTFVLTIGTAEYPFDLEIPKTLKSGVQTEIALIMKEGKVVNISGSINPWEADTDERIAATVPQYILDKLPPYITVYNGATPPNIEGEYFVEPNECVYAEDNGFPVGSKAIPTYFKFLNQNMSDNTLDFQNQWEGGYESGEGSFISGSGNDFTVCFCNLDGVSNEVWTKGVKIISGTKTEEGIENLRYAFFLTDKNDPYGQLMEIGIIRVFKDGSGLASNAERTRGGTFAYQRDIFPLFLKSQVGNDSKN